jgi:hypothetical protein
MSTQANQSAPKTPACTAHFKFQLRLLDRFNAMSGNHRRLVTLRFKALAEKGRK